MNLDKIGSVIMGILDGNPQNEPLHYGEVFSMWSNLLANHGAIAASQTFVNHTGDEDLRKLVEEGIEGLKEENKQIEQVLKANGIGLPPAPPERPTASLEEIPVGARFSDPEISATLSKNTGEALVACSQVIAQCVREDIALMYGQFHMTKAQYGAKLLKLNKSKGWLVPPPLHLNGPEHK